MLIVKVVFTTTGNIPAVNAIILKSLDSSAGSIAPAQAQMTLKTNGAQVWRLQLLKQLCELTYKTNEIK